MRKRCEKCDANIDANGKAYICSYECTFCANCATNMKHGCPSCGGELQQRPRRTA
ncbi:MAG: DUF1272 domain-containing protein [Acidiferrobacterales bacterium]